MSAAVKDQTLEIPSATQIDRQIEEFAGRFLRGDPSADDNAAFHTLVVQRFRPMRLHRIESPCAGTVVIKKR